MRKIELEHIQNYATSRDYSNGHTYYKQKKVLELKCIETEDSVEIDSSVKGSFGNQYFVKLNITDHDSYFSFDGRCNCFIGYKCKHLLATLIQYVEEGEKDILVDWLNSFKLNDNTATKKDFFLTYRLFSKLGFKYTELQIFKSKFLKTGVISNGIKVDMYNVLNGKFDNITTNEDKEILRVLTGLYYSENEKYKDRMFIGKVGYEVLLRMIATKKCYLNDHKEPFLFDEKNILNVQFSLKKKEEEYFFTSNFEKPKIKVLFTNPLLVFDLNSNIAQKGDIESELYEKLISSPSIQKEDISRVYSFLDENIPGVDLKAPSGMDVVKIQEKPIARISLGYLHNNDNKDITAIKLDFIYGEFDVSFYPNNKIYTKYKDGLKVDIKKDLLFEENAKKEIENFGFIFDENSKKDLNVVLDNENRQANLQILKSFLKHLDSMEENGWIINKLENFNLVFESNADVVVESENSNDWFSLSFNLSFNGKSQPIAPLVSSIIEEFDDINNIPDTVNLEIEKNCFVEVESKKLKPIIKTILELFNKKGAGDKIRLSGFDAHLLEYMDDDIIWKGSKEVLELSKKLKSFKEIEKVEPPKELKATLRDYQQSGLDWLNFLYEFKFGGILADDMGLGKTIQTLAHLSRLKANGKMNKPTLIILPTSLISNWKNEIAKFTPNLTVLSLYGVDRKKDFDKIEKYDLVLTTYALVTRDQDVLFKKKFFYIVLDEAQKIKNHKTKMSIIIKQLTSEYKLALSGTPIENHLGELWSIFGFLMPGFLDTYSYFKKSFQTPIEKEHDRDKQELLNRRIKPFMLRRTKDVVANELPAKTEIIKYAQFSSAQSQLYEAIRVSMEDRVKDAVAKKGIGSSHITILDALLKLRQVCCDPSLLKIEEAKKLKESAKLDLFLELLDSLMEQKRKVLVFSQFTSMLSILEKEIQERKISYTKLTGSSTKREEIIDRFTSGKADVFLISLKAGGVGLNLVEADSVIHYDPWWNPAVENQATDRAHRIGQKKAVFVYKLIVQDTIEQKILDLQKKKKALQDGIYSNKETKEDSKLNGNELLELLKI